MITALLLAAAAGCTPPATVAVVGFYEGRATSKGGIGHAIELKADGTALTGSTVIVGSPYRVASGHLFVGGNDAGALTVRGGVLFLDSGGVTLRKTSLDARTSGSILGSWAFQHYSGARAYERYRPDGRMEFRLPLSSYSGCYSAAGGRLSLTQPKASSNPFELRGNTLVLHTPTKDFLYDRAEAWYPRADVGVLEPKQRP